MEQQRLSEAGVREPAFFTPEQVRERLRDVALFQGLDGADLDEVLRIAETTLVEADESLFEEGERGDHFHIIVRGRIELRKSVGRGVDRLAVLKEGQAFGEMALLNQTPRSASAVALEDTYLLSVSRDAFGALLGGETLAVRLLRNLSKALWATSVRLAAQKAEFLASDTPHEALADFNRLLRARLLPRVTPRVSGWDVAASTLAPRKGVGSSSWDWFVLNDGRPAFAVVRAERADIFSAQRLAGLRTLLRSAADVDHESLGHLVTHVNAGLRSGWIDGLSGPMAAGVVALDDEGAEWLGAGAPVAMVVRATGVVEPLGRGSPALGARAGHRYEAARFEMGRRDKLIMFSGAPRNAAALVTSVVAEGYTSNSRDALAKLFERFGAGPDGVATDLTGAVVTRTRS